MQNLKKVQNCVARLRDKLPQGFMPQVGIILGTGLGHMAACLDAPARVAYEELPEFPLSTVLSHQGAFVAGFFSGVPVLLQQGRCHLYEGKSPAEVCMGVRVLAGMGVGALIITNAAGALNPQFEAGGLMLLTDHINLSGQSPLRGCNQDCWGPRFPDMSRVYDPAFLRVMEEAALARGMRLEKGVYVCVPGPELETPAETRAYRLLGADAIGMSTVPEVIAARHMGLRVAGVSCLSNKNLPDCMESMTIEEIIDAAARAGEKLALLLQDALPKIAAECGAAGT